MTTGTSFQGSNCTGKCTCIIKFIAESRCTNIRSRVSLHPDYGRRSCSGAHAVIDAGKRARNSAAWRSGDDYYPYRVGETVLGQGTVLGHFDLSGYVTYIITYFLHFFWHKRKVPCLGTMLILNRFSELYK